MPFYLGPVYLMFDLCSQVRECAQNSLIAYACHQDWNLVLVEASIDRLQVCAGDVICFVGAVVDYDEFVGKLRQTVEIVWVMTTPFVYKSKLRNCEERYRQGLRSFLKSRILEGRLGPCHLGRDSGLEYDP